MAQSLTETLAHYAASSSLAAILEAAKEWARQVIFDEMAGAHFCQRRIEQPVVWKFFGCIVMHPGSPT
jgi:hypothetical protein